MGHKLCIPPRSAAKCHEKLHSCKHASLSTLPPLQYCWTQVHAHLHCCLQEVPSGQSFSKIAYGPDNLLAAAFDHSLQFLDATSGHVLETIDDAHEGPITAIEWAPVSHTAGSKKVAVLASASLDKKARLWRAPQR